MYVAILEQSVFLEYSYFSNITPNPKQLGLLIIPGLIQQKQLHTIIFFRASPLPHPKLYCKSV